MAVPVIAGGYNIVRSPKSYNSQRRPAASLSEPGRNLQGEDIVWVDYDAAVSMHRVRANNPAERRLERLARPASTTTASPTAASTCPRLSTTPT